MKLFEPRVPVAKADELGFPDALFMDFDQVVAFDNLRHSLHVIAEVRCDGGRRPARPLRTPRWPASAGRMAALARPLRDRRAPAQPTAPPSCGPGSSAQAFEGRCGGPRSTSRPATASRSCSRSASTPRCSVPPFEVYRALRRVNPSPYLFYLQNGDQALVGSSPETLIKLEDGEVTLRPIAGTRRAGSDAGRGPPRSRRSCAPTPRRTPSTSCWSTWGATTWGG